MVDDRKRRRSALTPVSYVIKRRVRALRDALGRVVSGFIPDPAAVPVLVPVYVRPRRRR